MTNSNADKYKNNPRNDLDLLMLNYIYCISVFNCFKATQITNQQYVIYEIWHASFVLFDIKQT